jgi:hypothetical protein
LPALTASSILAALLLSPASAAEVTDLPPNLRGDVHLAYAGEFQQAGLEEGGATYAIRNVVRHDLGLRLEFAAYKGVVITLGIPNTLQQRITYPAAREMLYEPVEERGSYVNGAAIEAPTYVSGGNQGVWIGTALAPFSTNYRRNFGIDTRIDIGVRTPGAGSTLYGPNRGAHPGGAGFRLGLAASLPVGRTNSYVALNYVHEFGAKVPIVVDNAGNVLAEELPVKGASQLDATAGAEFVLREQNESASRVALDLYVGFAYRAWADRASGFYLPDVLVSSQPLTVSQGDYIVARGGAAIDYHVNRYVGVRLGAEGRYFTPHTVEHLYEVKTDVQSYEVAWTLALVGRIRLKGD